MARSAQTDTPARSLSVMADRKDAGVSKVTKFRAEVLRIEIEEGFNCRPIDPDHVAEFEASYRAGRYVPELVVRVEPGTERGRERIILVAGHHRLTALVNLIRRNELTPPPGEDCVKVEVTQTAANDAERILLMLNDASTLAVTPMQLGRQYAKLKNSCGWTTKDIAKARNKSETHVKQLLEMGELPARVQKRVEAGEIKSHHAIKMHRQHGEKVVEAMDEAMKKARLRGKNKITPKDSVGATPQDFIKAIRTDWESGGTFKCEDLCPAYADLAQYLRNSHRQVQIKQINDDIDEINGKNSAEELARLAGTQTEAMDMKLWPVKTGEVS